MPPQPSSYSPKVSSLIQKLKTPAAVQAWLRTLRYNPKDTMRTIEGVVRTRSAHCLEAAIAAAVILEHHGYPPLILDLESADLLDHTLFLYQENKKYGTVGSSREHGLHGRRPVFATVRSLVQSYAAPYIDAHAQIEKYGVLDLRNLTNTAWRTSKRNVWYLEERLRNVPHQKFHLPNDVVKYWRNRYINFRKKYPDKEPKYYSGQHFWI